VSARAARLLRERVAATPEMTVRLERRELLRAVGPAEDAGEPDPRAYAHGMLVHEGLRCRPPLTADERDVQVTLVPDRALAGALCVLVPAAFAAAQGLWLYGVAVALAGAAVVWALSQRWRGLARRAPRVIPCGFLLGVAAGLAVVALVGVAVVLPVREARTPGVVVAGP
jgi:hypothetical protein